MHEYNSAYFHCMSTYPRWKDGVRLFFLGLIGSLGHLLLFIAFESSDIIFLLLTSYALLDY